MDCPKCRAPMIVFEHEGIELDYCVECSGTWFDGDSRVALDEEVIGLGKYGYTLTILSGEELPDDPDQEEDEEADLIEQWTPRFAYKR